MKVLTIENNVPTIYENFVEFFQGISQKNLIIQSTSDEKFTLKDGAKSKDIEIYILNNEGLNASFLTSIEAYRDDLRVSMANLKKQGLVSDETLKKLAEQFSFMSAKKEEKKAS